jgi:hypothetical protein
MAAQSKAWSRGRSLAEVEVSNPGGEVMFVLCDVQ